MSNQELITSQYPIFRDFAQSQGYGTTIAPEIADLYSVLTVNPSTTTASPDVLTFFNPAVQVDIFETVQTPNIRDGSQVPTQNLLGLVGVAVELDLAALTTYLQSNTVLNVLDNSLLEIFIASDRQMGVQGSMVMSVPGFTGGNDTANSTFGPQNPIGIVAFPSTRIVMPGSTIRAVISVDGSSAAWQAINVDLFLKLHIWSFNARR